MKQISFEESRNIMHEILKDIDAFCRKEGINYTLGEGSLIGAVRHRGMIPWDDDMDILMLRENYDRFIASYKSEKYEIQQYDYKLNSWFLVVKVVDPRTIIRINDTGEEPYGLWVTIFPIDNAPDDDEELKRMEENIRNNMRLFGVRNNPWRRERSFMRNILVYLFHLILLPFSKDYWHNKAEREMKKYNNIKTQRRGQFAIWGHRPWVCAASAFDEYIDADFDGINCLIIKGYDDYLKCQYGDYMQLPPVEQQVPKHEYTAYWK